ncbi:MAG: hypothetical protein ACTSVR_04805 [Candidatus Thorarchaeota archaeon]
MRKEIYEFAVSMETEMAVNDEDKGDSWCECRESYLYEKLTEEFIEYFQCRGFDNLQIIQVIVAVMRGIEHKTPSTNHRKECSDIGNIAMMLYHRHKPTPEPPTDSDQGGE